MGSGIETAPHAICSRIENRLPDEPALRDEVSVTKLRSSDRDFLHWGCDLLLLQPIPQ